MSLKEHGPINKLTNPLYRKGLFRTSDGYVLSYVFNTCPITEDSIGPGVWADSANAEKIDCTYFGGVNGPVDSQGVPIEGDHYCVVCRTTTDPSRELCACICTRCALGYGPNE